MMNKNEIKIKDLLSKYKLNSPVPQDVQDIMMSQKKDIYINIIKSMGQVSFISSIILSLYFSLKKIGISLTLTKLFIIITITASAVSGTYIITKKIMLKDEKILNENIRNVQETIVVDNNNNNNIKRSTVKMPSHYPIAVYNFTSSSIKDRSKLRGMTKSIIGKLKINSGESNIILFSKKENYTSDFNIFGTVEEMDDKFILTIKIVEAKTSSMIYITQEETNSLENISNITEKISKEISHELSRKRFRK